MRFQPKSEETLEKENKFKLLEPGIYDFQISDATPEVSQKGNDMIKLKLCIWNHEGNPQYVFDYLLESMAYKLRHCADACGLIDKYESGELEPVDLIDKTGKVKIVIQKSKDPKYPDDKNAVQDYVKRASLVQETASRGKQPPAGLLGEGEPLDDEIPF